MRSFVYDWMYRFGAPWEGEARSELVGLVESGRLTPSDPGPRAVDLGCGSGANAIFLSHNGFDVTGIDFSPVALKKAEQKAAGSERRPRFVQGDLTALKGVDGPFDLLVDYGTLDDLTGDARKAMARTIVGLARPGSRFLLWCFYGERSALPRISFTGPSRLSAGLARDEEQLLFADDFEIETLAQPAPATHGFACFLMSRRPPPPP